MADCTSAKTRAAILRRRALAIAFGAACVAGVSSAALAQKRATSIEEVVVTAQQRAQSLRDVPISISVFNNDAIESAMMGDVGDYVVPTPYASFISNGARSRRQISMRGITNFAGESDPVRSSTFGFYIDGFNASDGEEDVGMREGVPSGVFSTFAGETLFAGFPDRDGDGCAGGQLCDSGNRRQHSAYQCGSGACQR